MEKIKAGDLRIGNLALMPLTAKVTVISVMDIGDIDGGYKERHPIPLSPSILEKCGFSHHDRTVNFNDSGYDPKTYFYISDGVDDYGQRKFLYGFHIGQFRDEFYYQAGQRRNKGIRITSLHQLQNLYHALTGEELSIQPI